ncbi:MAG: LysR substrate-binding domain-containing protein [Planctomycetota bacterium]
MPTDDPEPSHRPEPSQGTERADADLPSLTALASFEASLRHRSFTAAARELGRTQGAVSRQVALVEQHVGAELFHREQAGLRPTGAAELLGARVRRVLAHLRSALADAREGGEKGSTLHLALLPTFGTTWLIPRLPRFIDAHEGLAVELTTSLRTFDFEEGEIDAAIHYGAGAWPGARAERLMKEEVVVVCAPSRAEGVKGAADVARGPLLHLVGRPGAWGRWLKERVTDSDVSDGRRGPRFEHHAMVVEAAAAGLGYALLPDFAAARALRDGRLVEPLPGTRARTGSSYWLVYPDRSLELASLRAFRDWLRAEIRADRGEERSG